jgi:hypothetical protein
MLSKLIRYAVAGLASNGDCVAFFWKGVDAIGERDLKAGEDYLGRAVAADAGCFLAYLLLSQLSYAEGDDAAATAYLHQLPAEPPELTALYDDVAKALRADDYGRVASAAGDLVAAYPQTMTAVAALHLLGRAQYYLGRKTEAKTTLKTAYMYSDLAPGTVPAYGSDAEAKELEEFVGAQ